ncbi:MAG: hypothetical protein ACKN81_14080, partial [Pirellulaceae bacterium]
MNAPPTSQLTPNSKKPSRQQATQICIIGLWTLSVASLLLPIFASLSMAQAPFPVIPAKAYHILPDTTTEESGYFSLCEGKNGKIYIGTAAYGRNAYLVEFDPVTESMQVVVDVHRTIGAPVDSIGYAAQAKIHTRNAVGASGRIYFGTKQGYLLPWEKERQAQGINPSVYRGGFVLAYDPDTQKTENLGSPMPLGDPRLPADAKEGEGVIDVAVDESLGLLYAITCESQHWMLSRLGDQARAFRDLGPILRDQPNTLIDWRHRATAMTHDYQIARYDPASDTVTIDPLRLGDQSFQEAIGQEKVHPDWRLAPDGKTAYLQLLNDLPLFRIPLDGEAGQPVVAENLGDRIQGLHPDSRGSISIASDGSVFTFIRIDNQTGYGTGYIHHLIRFLPDENRMIDLGVPRITNPNYFDFEAPPR